MKLSENLRLPQIYLILDAKFGNDPLLNKQDELTTSCSFLSFRFSISNNESFANSDCIMSTLRSFLKYNGKNRVAKIYLKKIKLTCRRRRKTCFIARNYYF